MYCLKCYSHCKFYMQCQASDGMNVWYDTTFNGKCFCFFLYTFPSNRISKCLNCLFSLLFVVVLLPLKSCLSTVGLATLQIYARLFELYWNKKLKTRIVWVLEYFLTISFVTRPTYEDQCPRFIWTIFEKFYFRLEWFSKKSMSRRDR